MTNPDFISRAQAMGVHANRREMFEELTEKMKEFIEYSGDIPVFMGCLVETNEHVFPMVRLLSVSSWEGLTRVVLGSNWKSSTRKILHKSLMISKD
jgi:hypothetical protein